MCDIDEEWKSFLELDYIEKEDTNEEKQQEPENDNIPEYPKCSGITISTKVKVLYLNIKDLDIYKIFWLLDVIHFWEQKEGILKKQIKITCNSQEEYKDILERNRKDKNMSILKIKHVEKEITNHNKSEEEQQNIFKNISKVTVGMSKKDILNYRTKVKGAFYNCFMLVLRVKDDDDDEFKEVNIKIFNTGKMSFPGMISNNVFEKSLRIITDMLSNILDTKIFYIKDSIDTVLINSNFSCGYYLDRNKLFNILKYDYKLHVNFDPCSYPGIQCKYFINTMNKENNGRCICTVPCCHKGNGKDDGNCRQISFMIFRTGSVLIVGKCSDELLMTIYEFLKKILYDNYKQIYVNLNVKDKKTKEKTQKKKYIYVDSK